MSAPALLAVVLLAAGAPSSSAPDEIYRLGREALSRGAFDVSARLFASLENEPSIAGTAGYAFNRAQSARFLAEAGEAVYWYTRYLALAPQAADAATVRELAAKLVATHSRSVRAEVVRRDRVSWRRQMEDFELERMLRSCPEVELVVRFGSAEAVLGGTAYGYPGRIVYWDFPESGPGTMWVVPMVPVAPPGDVGGSPFLLLPAGRPFPVPVGPDLVSPAVTLAPPTPEFSMPDPALAASRIEVTAHWNSAGPPVLLVARRTSDALLELRSAAADGPFVTGRKRRDAPAEPAPLAFGPRAARPESKGAPKGLLAAFVLPLKEGTHQAWCAPLSLFDVGNRFGLRTTDARATHFWVRGDAAGPSLLALSK